MKEEVFQKKIVSLKFADFFYQVLRSKSIIVIVWNSYTFLRTLLCNMYKLYHGAVTMVIVTTASIITKTEHKIKLFAMNVDISGLSHISHGIKIKHWIYCASISPVYFVAYAICQHWSGFIVKSQEKEKWETRRKKKKFPIGCDRGKSPLLNEMSNLSQAPMSIWCLVMGMRYELGTKPEQQTSILLLPLLSQFSQILRESIISFLVFFHHRLHLHLFRFVHFTLWIWKSMQIKSFIMNNLSWFFFRKMSNKWRSWIQFSQKCTLDKSDVNPSKWTCLFRFPSHFVDGLAEDTWDIIVEMLIKPFWQIKLSRFEMCENSICVPVWDLDLMHWAKNKTHFLICRKKLQIVFFCLQKLYFTYGFR